MMPSSHLIEKLKFGEKYILVDLVVMPLVSLTESENQKEYEHAAQNKYLTRDVWQSFVYRKLYELFRKHLAEHDKDNDRLFQVNKEYRLHYAERPYLQMKYAFRDKTYRNNLNIIFKEKLSSLHNNCIYVEISDQGRIVFDRVEDRDKTVLRLLKEIDELKQEKSKIATEAIEKTQFRSTQPGTEIEEYHPEPIKKTPKSNVEEYVPVTRNGLTPGMKRTYKPSKIVNPTIKPLALLEPDPYTPGSTIVSPKVSYIPSPSPNSKPDPHKKLPKAVKVERNLFGSDDDEYDPASATVASKLARKDNIVNDSSKDIFSDGEQNSMNDDEGKRQPSDSEKCAPSGVMKREQLPRNSKLNSRPLMAETPEEKEKQKVKSIKKTRVLKTEENLNSLLKQKNGIRKRIGSKKEGFLGKQEKLTEIASELKRLSKDRVLDCTSLSKEEILDTFQRYRQELEDIFMRFKDKTERQWKSSSELCYFTDLGNILDDEQKFTMLQHLEDQFVESQERGKYTEFFTSSLLMEWGLRIFMDRHQFESRQSALERIKQQERSYLASLPNDFLMKYP